VDRETEERSRFDDQIITTGERLNQVAKQHQHLASFPIGQPDPIPKRRATVKTIHLARCTLVRARAGIEVTTSVRIARSVPLVEQTGVMSNTHTCETNLRGRWRKDRKLKLKRRTTKTKTTTPGNRYQAMLPGPLKSATGSTPKLVKRVII
jgi:hypothetical protein